MIRQMYINEDLLNAEKIEATDCPNLINRVAVIIVTLEKLNECYNSGRDSIISGIHRTGDSFDSWYMKQFNKDNKND